ncbi:histone-like nucleoid-structuring protein Lsr2 [Streptomyces canus]|uniref:Lsr2 family DNA-binding protein n=1 Tax=Streptomyces canus TaxID=58343 RepID=UPI0033A283F7
MDEVFGLLAAILLLSESVKNEDCGVLFPTLRDAVSVVEDSGAGDDGILALADAGVRILGDLRGKTPHDLRMMLQLSREEVEALIGHVMQIVALPEGKLHSVALMQWFGELDGREQSILLLHRCAREPQALGILAATLRTPLERIQELSEGLPRRLQTAMEDSRALRAAVAEFDRATAAPVPRTRLLERFGWLDDDLPEDDVNLLALLSNLREVNTLGRWMCRDNVRQRTRQTLKILDLEDNEVMSGSVARRILNQHGWAAAHIDEWLDFCGIAIQNGQLYYSAAAIADLPDDPYGEMPEQEKGSLPTAVGGIPSPDRLPSSVTEGDHSAKSQNAPLGAEAAEPTSQTTLSAPVPADALAIRAWARRNGFEIAERGRIPRAVQEAYIREVGGTFPASSQREVTSPSLVSGDQPRVRNALAEEFEALASAMSAEERGVTFGSVVRYGEELPANVQKIVHRILNATLSEDGWIVDAVAPAIHAANNGHGALQGTLKQRAWKVLEEADHPLSTASLVSKMGDPVNERSLKVQLAADMRFMRSDIDSWALSDWQLRPYTSVRELVGEEVDKAGGSINSDQLIRNLTQAFSIKESTVRQVMSSPPFTARGGFVQRLTDIAGEGERGDAGRRGDSASEGSGVQLARDLGLDF